MDQKRVYLDYAATAPLSPAALKAVNDCFLNGWGNASALYRTGRAAKAVLEDARTDMARALSVKPQELYFTSGGSESDNWAVKGVMRMYAPGQAHLISTQIEHPAMLNACLFLRRMGYDVTLVPPDPQGRVRPEEIEAAIRPDTRLISVMAANNEVGTIQPIEEIARIARQHGILMHTDAVQAAGLFPLIIQQTGVDLLSLSGHKFGGPKGVGALYIRQGIRLEPLIHGGEQERGFRASTENVPGIAGMAAAFRESAENAVSAREKLASLRKSLCAAILSGIPDARLNGDPVHHLPGHAHFSIPGVRDETLIPLLDLNGVEASAGSACTAGSFVESHVLRAMGVSGELLRGSLRLTMGAAQTEEDILYAAQVIVRTVRKLRGNN